MIGYLSKEPLLKKMFFLFIIFLLLFAAMSTISNIYFLASIYSEQIQLTQKMVGKLVNFYPEKELDIVNVVLNEKDDNDMEIGKKILKRYGYDLNTSMYYDNNFKAIIKKYIIIWLLLLVFVIVLNIYLFLYGAGYYIKKLEGLSIDIDNIMDGKYKNQRNEEGILGRIYVQTYQMARRLSIGKEKLNNEKENIKSLVTDISHQIKTPLSSIKLFNALLLEEDISSDEAKEFLYRSKNEINKLEWLIHSLVKLSRMEVGMIKLKKEVANIKETIFKAVDGINIKAKEKGIKIEIGQIKDIYTLHDTRWTKEAIFNVLENGVKYTDRGGYIKINIIELESYLRIDIEDNGIGIPKEEYNDIFKRFYRGKSDKVKNTEGSGVGLFLTRKILEEQGGSIIVNSIEGYGTRFSLFLPYKTVREYESLM